MQRGRPFREFSETGAEKEFKLTARQQKCRGRGSGLDSNRVMWNDVAGRVLPGKGVDYFFQVGIKRQEMKRPGAKRKWPEKSTFISTLSVSCLFYLIFLIMPVESRVAPRIAQLQRDV